MPQAYEINGQVSPKAINFVSIPGPFCRAFSATLERENSRGLFKAPRANSLLKEVPLSNNSPITILQLCIRGQFL